MEKEFIPYKQALTLKEDECYDAAIQCEKIARPINLSKNKFVEWLKENKAEEIEVYEGQKSNEWDYYRHVSAFVGESLYTVYFTIWKGITKIDYSDDENRYKNLSVEDFNQLLWQISHNYSLTAIKVLL